MCLPALCLAYLFKARPDTVATSTTRQAPSRKRQPSCTGPRSILAPKALGASPVITGTGLDTGSMGKSGAQAACDRGVTEGWPRPYTSAHRITEAVELHGGQQASHPSPPRLQEKAGDPPERAQSCRLGVASSPPRVLELLTMSSKVCLRAELLSEWSGEERRKTRERRRGDGDGDDSSSGLSGNACKLV